MRRRLPRIRSALAGLALTLVGVAALPAGAEANWGRPFQLAPPGTLDVLPPQLAISSDGSAAAAFGLQDVDTPGSAQAYLTLRSAAGAVGAPAAVGARQILSLGYDGRSLELLTGASPAGETCCSTAQAVRIGAGGSPSRARTLVGGLTGTTLGRLLTLSDGQMLAAVATERGVWVVQSTRADRFGAQHRLTGGGRMPETLAAAPLGGERSLVAWTAATGPAGATDPRSIYTANGSRVSAPHGVHTLLTVAAGHRIDELGAAPRAGQGTVGWIESWYDRGGAYHSQVMARDLTARAGVRALSSGGRLASGLTLAGDAAGDQAVAWESCTVDAACTTQVAVRRAGGAFGPARSLGATDADETPALAVGPRGAVVAWIQGGDPVAAVAAAPGRAFGAPTVLSRAGYALDITAAEGPRRSALVAWSQGTLNPSVVGAADGG